jgi:hypothetical protein
MHETTFDNFDTENKINNLMFFIQKKKKHQDSYVSIHMKKKMKWNELSRKNSFFFLKIQMILIMRDHNGFQSYENISKIW